MKKTAHPLQEHFACDWAGTRAQTWQPWSGKQPWLPWIRTSMQHMWRPATSSRLCRSELSCVPCLSHLRLPAKVNVWQKDTVGHAAAASEASIALHAHDCHYTHGLIEQAAVRS